MSDESAAVVRRVLPAPPRMVYDEWLDPDSLADWMCPLEVKATLVECDPRIGGSLRIDMDDAGRVVQVTGQYVDLDPPHRLVFTWNSGGGVIDSLVTVTLEPHGEEETIMTIHHAPLPPASVGDYRQGWAEIGEKLEERLHHRR
jgi:uncharacterized protein YndB with AHSA1/START domain